MFSSLVTGMQARTRQAESAELTHSFTSLLRLTHVCLSRNDFGSFHMGWRPSMDPGDKTTALEPYARILGLTTMSRGAPYATDLERLQVPVPRPVI